MKQIKFFAVALAALTMFSCSKENTPGTENQGPGKTMQITVAKAPESRSSGASGGETELGTSYVLGFDGKGTPNKLVYKESVIIKPGEAAQVNKVPDTTIYFAIVSNLSEEDAKKITLAMSYADYQKLLLDVATYQDITKVPVTNIGDQTLDTSTSMWTLELSIAPMMSRIEVASITANPNPTNATDKVTAFDLVGVHVNGYFTQFTMEGKQGEDWTHYVKDNTLLRATDVVPSWSYDYFVPALTGETTYTAAIKTSTPNDIWYYMISPADKAEKMPHIVFEIKNVYINNQVATETKKVFITVKSFKDINGTPIIQIDRNTLFKISDVQFDATHLSIDPNQEAVSVEATVTLEAWKEVAATPEL